MGRHFDPTAIVAGYIYVISGGRVEKVMEGRGAEQTIQRKVTL